MIEAKHILVKFKQRWQLLLYLEVFLYALGSAILIYFLSSNVLLTLCVFIVLSTIMTLIKKPWQPNLTTSSSYIDNHLENLEYSTSLLLKPSENLSSLAMLQQQKVEKVIIVNKEKAYIYNKNFDVNNKHINREHLLKDG